MQFSGKVKSQECVQTYPVCLRCQWQDISKVREAPEDGNAES